MFLSRALILGILLAFSAHAADEGTPVPDEFVKMSDSIQKESSRQKRLEMFSSLQALVKKRVQEIPSDIDESAIAKTEVLFELDLFVSGLKNEQLTPASCSRTQTSIASRANPLGDGESGMNPTGRFVMNVVKSLCRE